MKLNLKACQPQVVHKQCDAAVERPGKKLFDDGASRNVHPHCPGPSIKPTCSSANMCCLTVRKANRASEYRGASFSASRLENLQFARGTGRYKSVGLEMAGGMCPARDTAGHVAIRFMWKAGGATNALSLQTSFVSNCEARPQETLTVKLPCALTNFSCKIDQVKEKLIIRRLFLLCATKESLVKQT